MHPFGSMLGVKCIRLCYLSLRDGRVPLILRTAKEIDWNRDNFRSKTLMCCVTEQPTGHRSAFEMNLSKGIIGHNNNRE